MLQHFFINLNNIFDEIWLLHDLFDYYTLFRFVCSCVLANHTQCFNDIKKIHVPYFIVLHSYVDIDSLLRCTYVNVMCCYNNKQWIDDVYNNFKQNFYMFGANALQYACDTNKTDDAIYYMQNNHCINNIIRSNIITIFITAYCNKMNKIALEFLKKNRYTIL